VPDPNAPDPVQTRLDTLKLSLLDSKGLRNIPSPKPIIDRHIFKDSLSWISGAPGHGKSFVAAHMACCIGTGREWFGHQVTKGKVLYLIAEGVSGFSDRIETWEEYHGEDAENVIFLPVPIQFLSDVDVDAFGQLLVDLQPDITFIDTQARCTVGYRENDSGDMGEFVDKLEVIRRASGSGFVMVHHTPRNGENLRGSSAMEGAATSILHCMKEGNQVTIKTQKQKDSEEPKPFDLQLMPHHKSAVLELLKPGAANLSPSEMTIVKTIQDFLPGEEWVAKGVIKNTSGLPEPTAYRAINSLIRKGYVAQRGERAKQLRYIPDQDRLV
jgi:hypothetical protein